MPRTSVLPQLLCYPQRQSTAAAERLATEIARKASVNLLVVSFSCVKRSLKASQGCAKHILAFCGNSQRRRLLLPGSVGLHHHDSLGFLQSEVLLTFEPSIGPTMPPTSITGKNKNNTNKTRNCSNKQTINPSNNHKK